MIKVFTVLMFLFTLPAMSANQNFKCTNDKGDHGHLAINDSDGEDFYYFVFEDSDGNATQCGGYSVNVTDDYQEFGAINVNKNKKDCGWSMLRVSSHLLKNKIGEIYTYGVPTTGKALNTFQCQYTTKAYGL